MLSSQMRRRRTNQNLTKNEDPSPTRELHRAASTTLTSPRESTTLQNARKKLGFAASHAALHTESYFRPDGDLTILDSKVLVSLPTLAIGILWNSWDRAAMEYDNTEKGHEVFVRDLVSRDTELKNQLHRCADNLAMLQTFTSVGAGSSELVQAIIAIFDFLNEEDFAMVQVIFGAVTAGLALLIKFISAEIINIRNNSLAYQNEVLEMLNIQNNKVPIVPDKYFYKSPSPLARRLKQASLSAPGQEPLSENSPLLPVNESKQNYASDSMALTVNTALPRTSSAPEAKDLPTAANPFVPMENIIINGSEVVVTMPVRVKHWFGRDTFEIQTVYYPNDEDGFSRFIESMIRTGIILDNRIDDFNEWNFSVTTITANLIALVEILKTSITAAQPFTSGTYKLFQTGTSSVVACFSFFSQYASKSTAAGRDEAAHFKGKLSDMVNKQFKP